MTNPNTMTRLTGRAAPGIRTLGLIAASLVAVVLCSCGSSAHSAASATQATCQRVSAAVAVASKKVDSICPGAAS